jgi:hypothetical protein
MQYVKTINAIDSIYEIIFIFLLLQFTVFCGIIANILLFIFLLDEFIY